MVGLGCRQTRVELGGHPRRERHLDVLAAALALGVEGDASLGGRAPRVVASSVLPDRLVLLRLGRGGRRTPAGVLLHAAEEQQRELAEQRELERGRGAGDGRHDGPVLGICGRGEVGREDKKLRPRKAGGDACAGKERKQKGRVGSGSGSGG